MRSTRFHIAHPRAPRSPRTFAPRRLSSLALALLASASLATAGMAPVAAATAADTTSASVSKPATTTAAPAAIAWEHRLRPTVIKAGDAQPAWSLSERMAHYRVPGVAVAILRDGKVVSSRGYGVRDSVSREPIDAQTLFSTGSVSKVVTAATTLRLSAAGKLDLDRNVNDYLKQWQVPADPKWPDARITLRMLMSHTGGFNVHGFPDLQPGEPLPSLLQTLNGQPPSKTEAVRLIHAPGAQQDYSGGGVTIEQAVIEAVDAHGLDAVARREVFEPLHMRRSGFIAELPATTANVARAHDEKGQPTALPRGWESFPELGASGLWTNADDLAAFVAALLGSYRGSNDFLPRALATAMMTEVAPGNFGLGPRLNGVGRGRVFHHGGANDHYYAWIEGHLDSGDGLVVLTNGAEGDRLITEIRNAVTDAAHWPLNEPVHSVTLAADAVASADYRGNYRLDPRQPMDLRGVLADMFDVESLAIGGDDAGAITLQAAGSKRVHPLLPLTPNRYVAPEISVPATTLQVEFHRGADGRVHALTVLCGESRAHYLRE
ncbi:serine hydrolase domain-containing protein [Lysobacter sp. Root690]|uniref:serine hydrolase domain-containing protein n=1 Tax=Lysobacter sp. Root690 TaxID=1736588 RepID=UPI0009E7F476|nr:serine hydrolase domain-containing protein [Lysobacter sp. Root690]